MGKDFIVKDKQGREILKFNDKGNIIAARYPDMSESYKKYIVTVFKEMTDQDPQKVRNFLDYKSDDNEFCV